LVCSLNFKKVIVTSGPTKEWIDPVRYISNASSGKMGFLIANEIQKWIQNVTYIYGGVQEKYSQFTLGKKIKIETTIDLLNAILAEIENDTLVIMAAAPADFRPLTSSDTKIKKSSSDNLILELTQNPDVLKSLKNHINEKNYSNTKLVGFAAETNDLELNAKSKLERKGLEFIIGNYVGKNSGFGEVNSGVKIYSKTGLELEIIDKPKEIISKEIVYFLKEKFS